MKIVVLDGYTLNPGDLSWDEFARLGDLTCHDRTPESEIVARIGDARAVITNKTPITRATLKACPGVKYVGVLATGYNVVDTAAARELGVVVTNVPTYGTAAVAQFVFALLLDICHHAAHHSDTVKAGRWQSSIDFCYWDYPLIELAGKTMGIVGFGRIGRAVAGIALAVGMKVLAFDERRDMALQTENLRYAQLPELLNQADVVSLHCPLTDATRGMIDAGSIAGMRDGAIIINTARGPLVDEAAVRAALDSGKLYWYAADVVSTEPITADNPLLGAKNVTITPHIAWAPGAARARLMTVAADNLRAFMDGRPVNVVNA